MDKTFEKLLEIPIDIESCFDPVFEPPPDFLDEWSEEWEPASPFCRTTIQKIGSAWYTIETECGGNEPLTNLMRRLIFSDKEAVPC